MNDEQKQEEIIEPLTENTTVTPPEMRSEDALRFAISLFADLAWIQLGIRANPASGETKTDLAQARVVIDAINALLPLTEGRFEAHEIRDLRNLLSSLQMNFVQRLTPGS